MQSSIVDTWEIEKISNGYILGYYEPNESAEDFCEYKIRYFATKKEMLDLIEQELN